MEVSTIKYYLIIQYTTLKHIKTYYNKFKTTSNLYNFILNYSKQNLTTFIKSQQPYLNKHYIKKYINTLSNNKIIYISNKINKINKSI